ncbi:acyl-CoA dehydrogenase [Actinoplanes sp. SE50]|uniref:acyl-CoA dehydrogenase family protein n=1 Tax=unclassified Actinoplanes TaxID=2626549 RepID=UPI00023EC70A|nr:MULTISPECIES: acyl-CoA dehydrogenase family protein [unclassified Actinoplanes]AEV81452.1 glutaryl-CoA dehydrogenase [Actinoplanes sp. SE50/110]ATO79855.1 acyl-CoA dehydrogenase [Actinoplanes sp. SE50]SLL97257.1 acyl-CoA dehydrogenase [Actinoplanes sp. SE50/110]
MVARPLDLLDLDDLLTDDDRAARALARQVANDHIRPGVAQWYENGDPPIRDLAVEFGKAGLFGMHLTGYGLPGATTISYGVACMELEAADSGIRSLVSVQGSLVMYAIWRYGSDDQKDRWLPALAAGRTIGCFGLAEPDHGSDPTGMSTRARRDGDDWILDGVKTWILNAPIADVAVIWARAEKGVAGFVVPTDTPGLTTRAFRHTMSLRAASVGELALDGVRLPDSARLPAARSLMAPLSCLTEARLSIIFGVLGAARDCLDVTLDYAAGREQFGRPISAFQLTQAKLADMALELQKGFLLAVHLGRMRDAGGAPLRPEQVSIGKLNNVREALKIARECRTILGGNGIRGEMPVMRHAGNLESVLTYEGTSEIHQLSIGQKLTGLNAFSH